MKATEGTDSWDALRGWCKACIERYLEAGRQPTRDLIAQLDRNAFRSAGQAAQEVVLSITDLLNEHEGLVLTPQEEKELFGAWDIVLKRNLSASDTLREFRKAQEQSNKP